jgi:hypothetical protein
LRLILVLLAAAILVTSADARRIKDPSESRKRNASPTCERFYWSCRSRHADNESGCRGLWDAAKASGGVWGEPKARESVGIKGRQLFCEN